MRRPPVPPTGREQKFRDDQIIVSKTDPRGIITYANQVFVQVSGYSEQELLGSPHNIIRHPDMPRCVFQVLWETLQAGREIFAYVVNLCKNGDHYWVLAHVTPSWNERGEIIAFHSSRRTASPRAVSTMSQLYQQLVRVERSEADPRRSLAVGREKLMEAIAKTGMSYGEFVFSLTDDLPEKRSPASAQRPTLVTA